MRAEAYFASVRNPTFVDKNADLMTRNSGVGDEEDNEKRESGDYAESLEKCIHRQTATCHASSPQVERCSGCCVHSFFQKKGFAGTHA